MQRRLKRLEFTRPILDFIGGLTPRMMMAMFEALPADFAIVGFYEDPARHVCGWVIKSEEFEPISEGSVIPTTEMIFTQDEHGYLKCVREDD